MERQPRGLSVAETEDGILLHLRWFSLGRLIPAVGLLAVVVAVNPLGSVPLPDPGDPSTWIPWVVWALFALALAAGIAMLLVNRTVLACTRRGLVVWHEPIPWFGGVDLAQGEVAFLAYDRSVQRDTHNAGGPTLFGESRRDIERGATPGPFSRFQVTHNLVAVFPGGSQAHLLQLDSPEEVTWVKNALGRHLGR